MDTSSTNKAGTNSGDMQLPFVQKPEIQEGQPIGADKPSPLQQAVLEYLEKVVPEAEKWQRVKELDKLFERTIKEIAKSNDTLKDAQGSIQFLKDKIEDFQVVDALGDINMQALRLIVNLLEKKVIQIKDLPKQELRIELYGFLQEYLDICKRALSSTEQSSEPVREQIFSNLCAALNIPAYPLERLDQLYNDFKDPEKRDGIDMTVEMNRDIQDEIDKQPGIEVFIDQQNTFWDTKRIQYFRKPQEEKEVVGREWDFWRTMTDKKFLIRQSKMQALKKLIDGEISFEDMRKESDKLSEIRSWKMN